MAAQLPNLSPQPPNSQPPKSPKPPKSRPKAKSTSALGKLGGFLSFWLRLLLLGMGGGIAWLLGVAIAQFYPAQNPDPPLQEVVMRQTGAVIHDITSLPQRWGQDSSAPSETNNIDLSELPQSQSDTPAATVPDSPPTNPEPLYLEPQAQEKAEAELAAIRTELERLQNRMAALEADVGQAASQVELAARIEQLSQRLDPETATNQQPPLNEPVTPELNGSDETAIALDSPSATDILNEQFSANIPESDTLKITLPSDVLFSNEPTLLNESARSILNSVVRDLQSYPGATIHVSGHTDNQIDAETRKTISFQQAKAVQSYLASQSGEQHRWITIGYGSLRSHVPNDSDLNRQRNRRIEVIIYPR